MKNSVVVEDHEGGLLSLQLPDKPLPVNVHHYSEGSVIVIFILLASCVISTYQLCSIAGDIGHMRREAAKAKEEMKRNVDELFHKLPQR